MLFHGTPGSRYFRHPDESIITSLGIRLVVPERPGYGLSDFQPHRNILDWADDVLALADVIEIERFGIIGYSGGGPHAAACALRIPHRLNGTAMVSSPAPFGSSEATADMVWLNRVLFGLSNESYGLAKISWWLMNAAFTLSPEGFLNFLSGLSHEAERETSRDPKVKAIVMQDFAEATAAGLQGTAWETVLIAREWGFRPQDIAIEVSLWQGEADVRTPPSMGRLLAEAIPNCKPRFFPGEGHDVIYRHWTEILLSLVPQKPEEESALVMEVKKKPRPRHRRGAKPEPVEPNIAQRKTYQGQPPDDQRLCPAEEQKDLVSTVPKSTEGE